MTALEVFGVDESINIQPTQPINWLEQRYLLEEIGTVNDIALLCKRSPVTVRKDCQSRKLASVKRKGTYLIPIPAAIEFYAKKSKV